MPFGTSGTASNKSHHGLDILINSDNSNFIGTPMKSMYPGIVRNIVSTFSERNITYAETDKNSSGNIISGVSAHGCDYSSGFGNYVIIEHTIAEGVLGIDGVSYTTVFVIYCHLNTVGSNLISNVTTVKAGDQIGTGGCSGNAANIDPSIYHLHIEANTSNSFSLGIVRMINPSVLFKNGIFGLTK